MKKILISLTLILSTVVYQNINAQEETLYSNDWESVKLKGLNLNRLEVPGGWLVREGLGKIAGLGFNNQTRIMLFMPDSDHLWRDVIYDDWETLKLKGLNLYRLRTPEGWLVREGIGKLGDDSQTMVMTFMPDASHQWQVKKK